MNLVINNASRSNENHSEYCEFTIMRGKGSKFYISCKKTLISDSTAPDVWIIYAASTPTLPAYNLVMKFNKFIILTGNIDSRFGVVISI